MSGPDIPASFAALRQCIPPTLATALAHDASDHRAILEQITGDRLDALALIACAVALYESGLTTRWRSQAAVNWLRNNGYWRGHDAELLTEQQNCKNWGAVQLGTPEALGVSSPCPARVATPRGEGVLYRDSNPTDDGGRVDYAVYLRAYGDLSAGAIDYVRTLYVGSKRWPRAAVLEAATRWNLYGVSREMYASHYYRGSGASAAGRIGAHFRIFVSCLADVCRELGIYAPRALRPGDEGDDVLAWKTAMEHLGHAVTRPDDHFTTADARIASVFQREAAIGVDGVPGPVTQAWADYLLTKGSPGAGPLWPWPPREPQHAC